MRKHILVIDDDTVLLVMAGDFLKEAGFAVSTADCGIYTNNIIYGKNPLAMIVFDVIMPLISGVKKAKLLKKREKVPTFLFSSYHLNKSRNSSCSLKKPWPMTLCASPLLQSNSSKRFRN